MQHMKKLVSLVVMLSLVGCVSSPPKLTVLSERVVPPSSCLEVPSELPEVVSLLQYSEAVTQQYTDLVLLHSQCRASLIVQYK